MKYLLSLRALALFISCQEEPKKPVEPTPQLTLLDSIALAYGYDNWSAVNTIQFSFNVARPDRTYKRSWIWNTRKQEVTSIIEGDTITYLRKAVDSTLTQTDARFINDKYWLLVPFNLVWDRDNFSYEVQDDVPAPISQQPLRKLTIVYGDTGGYTPGDAYDFYFTPDHQIKEWAWRKGNDSVPSVQTAWSEPQPFNGISISETHSNVASEPLIFFTDIRVEN